MLNLVFKYFKGNYSLLLFLVCFSLAAFLLVAINGFSRIFQDENIPNNTKNCCDNFKLVCYYNFPENISDLIPEKIPETLCTHIILAFARINQTDYSIKVSENDVNIIPRLCLLKTKNKDLKVMISVGGAGSDDFSQMVQNHSRRKMFINSTMRFIKKYKLDGVDIDWEWPGSDGNAQEKIKFVQLLQETRLEFDRHKRKYLLSIAAGALRSQIEIFYLVDYIKLYVDFINLMTYDYHYYTSYYPLTDYNAPLYASAKDKNSVFSELNVNFSVNYWILKLVPRDKLVLGIPAFGHTYLLMSSLNHDLHSPASGFGNVGQNGFIKYREVCEFLSLLNTFHIQDDDSDVPYAYNQYDWVSYDDEYSVGIKDSHERDFKAEKLRNGFVLNDVQKVFGVRLNRKQVKADTPVRLQLMPGSQGQAEFVVNEKLGGAMVYSLNGDDFLGTCRNDKMKFPLTTKIKSVFNGHSPTDAAEI